MTLVSWMFLAAMAIAQDIPEGLEEGSTAKNVKVEEGQTVDSLAGDYGVLPSEVRAWNDLAEDGELSAGDKIVIWMAPMAVPEEEPEEKEPKEKKPPGEQKERSGVSPFVGLQFGPAIPLSPLGVAPAPRLEIGVELPVWERRIRIFAAGSFARPVATGEGKDQRLPGNGGWTYELRQQEWTLAIGPTLRLPGVAGPFIPEFSLAPEIYLLQSKIEGAAGKNDFGLSEEQYTRIGVYIAAGGAFELGPGELTVNISMATSGLNGVVTGKASTAALTPMVGYRFVF